ncbi:glycosyltransferase family 2 protein [Lederbergia citri]|uniref:Glycosyltransferase family 2 protein n=1 Tax=Lederbergia citri TaxID=2833580 RepID=A0A942TEW3_9BACI|nr:glycosyltransferase family 2 protein [Lederbergia citri]MBS4195496.1 glycosyltransferase family 2 protein [Lederbergia citri]
MKKKITVIIPMYNTECYIANCLDSLKNQTYKNFEALIIDDGSSDNSYKIAHEYSKEDNRFKVFRQENKGASAARNMGLKLANGYYIYFLDSDDYINEKTFEKCIREFEHNDVDLVTFDAKCFLEKEYLDQRGRDYEFSISSFYDRSDILPFKKMSGYEYLKISIHENKFRGNSVLFIVKKEVLEKGNDKFIEHLTYFEDYIFLYYLIKNINKVKYLPEPLYFRRLTGNSLVTKDSNKERMFKDSLRCLKILTENHIENEPNYETINKMYKKMFLEIAKNLYGKIEQKQRVLVPIKILEDPFMFQLYTIDYYSLIKNKLVEQYNDNLRKLESLVEHL